MRKNVIAEESRAILALVPQRLISIRLFLWTFPISIIVVTFLIPEKINSGEELLKWFIIALLGHISMLPFVIYSRDKDGHNKQIPLLLMMGIVRGGVLGLLPPLLGVSDPLEIPWRITNSMVSIFYFFLVSAIVYEFQSAFRKELTRKIQEVSIKQAEIEISSGDVNSQLLISRISELQQKILATLSNTPTRENFEARAKDIDMLVRKHIRPLSKSQWKDGQLVWVNAGPVKVLRETLSVAPLHVWAVAILTLPFSIVGQYNRYGLLNTFVTQVTWLFEAWLVQVIARKLQPVRDGNYLKRNLTILFLVITIITPVMYWIHTIWPGNLFNTQSQVTAHLFSAITVTILLLVSSVIIALEADKAFVFETLGNAIKEKDFQDLISSGIRANTESKYGQYLHAEVQSQLLACKLLLLKAAESDFTLFSPEVTNQINNRLKQIQQPYERPAARIPSDRVKELSESWTGLAEITFDLSPEMSELHANSDVISQLIEESVVNSIRHGKAKQIHIKNIVFGDRIDFIISDNGILKAGQSQGGLGTILFNAFTESWSLNRVGDQTILKFSVRP